MSKFMFNLMHQSVQEEFNKSLVLCQTSFNLRVEVVVPLKMDVIQLSVRENYSALK